MNKYFDIIIKTRQVFLNLLDGLTIEQINKVPAGFNNNIVWNLAHLVVTPQLLAYKLSGLPFTIDEEFVNRYKKGTKPEGFVNAEEFETIKELFNTTTKQLVEDYNNGRFNGSYQLYTNSFNIEQTSVEDAIKFSSVHDGLHLGYAMALKRAVQAN